MSEDIAIKVDHVYKDFVLPHEKVSSVKSLFTGMLRRGKGKNKGTQHALKDISFEVKKGEFFGIVGRNGSGKSTMLKILASIYQPTSGSVQTNGKLVPFIELGVGFNPELTGRQNVYLNGAMLGFSEKEVSAMYDEIVTFAELEPFMDQKLKNYSSGMQVRLAFSMAVRSEAEILLVDEVLAVGDADFQRKCFNYFSQLKRANTTVVFISHDMSAVREYCDRAMLIDNNEVVATGPTDEIAQKYLRLFMDNADAAEQKEGDRWGDKAAEIDSVHVSAGAATITMTAKVRSKNGLSRPIAGVRIRDAAGAHITGTNTKQEKLALPSLKKDGAMTITWQLPNVLRDGQYLVDVAIQYPDEITVADWWDGAAELKIKKDRHLPYVIDPGFNVTYTQ